MTLSNQAPRAEGAGLERITPPSAERWTDELTAPAREPTKAERVRETAEKAIEALANALQEGRSEALTEYLGAMSRFHRYSFHNILLIAMQKPDATHVAGFHTWQKDFSRFVQAGERGIAILAPMVRKARSEATDGGEEAQTEARVLRGFRVVYVFDVKQTDGKPLPEFSTVSGDPGQHLDNLKALAARRGIELSYESDLGGAFGLSFGGKIRLLEGQTPAQEFSVLVHEVAHELLHKVEAQDRPDKTTRETEAEAVAYVVTSAVGLQTGTAAKDYIQLYRGDKETLARSLERIQQTASSILEAVLPGE